MKRAILMLPATLLCAFTQGALAAPPPPTATPTSTTASQDTTYQNCRRFDIAASDEQTNDPKTIATARLQGASTASPFVDNDTRQNRDACILLALQHGANASITNQYLNTPLIEAILNNDVTAFDALMQAKANPNVTDTDTSAMAEPTTALSRACQMGNSHMVLALIAAGANPVPSQPLWSAAVAGDDVSVQALLKTGKIPVSQITTIGDSDQQTALDASEVRLDKLNLYFKKFPAGQTAAASDKKDFIQNEILSLYPSFAGGSVYSLADGADPDAFVQQLLTKQGNVSAALKAAGWVCKEDNCGRPDPDMEAAELSQSDTSTP